jgi:hypothetical protein
VADLSQVKLNPSPAATLPPDLVRPPTPLPAGPQPRLAPSLRPAPVGPEPTGEFGSSGGASDLPVPSPARSLTAAAHAAIPGALGRAVRGQTARPLPTAPPGAPPSAASLPVAPDPFEWWASLPPGTQSGLAPGGLTDPKQLAALHRQTALATEGGLKPDHTPLAVAAMAVPGPHQAAAARMALGTPRAAARVATNPIRAVSHPAVIGGSIGYDALSRVGATPPSPAADATAAPAPAPAPRPVAPPQPAAASTLTPARSAASAVGGVAGPAVDPHQAVAQIVKTQPQAAPELAKASTNLASLGAAGVVGPAALAAAAETGPLAQTGLGAVGQAVGPDLAKSFWGSLGTGSKVMLGLGVGLTVLPLLLNLFGDSDSEDGKPGGTGFLTRILPLLGLGAAAWGATGGSFSQLPEIGRLGRQDFWTGVQRDLGMK